MGKNIEHDGGEIEAEQRFFHPELHADIPDQRDTGVDTWYHDIKKLESYDPAELEFVMHELEEIPEVADYETERVNLDKIAEMMSIASEYTPETQRSKLAKAEMAYSGLVVELDSLIDRYTDTVRRHQRLGILKFHDPDKYRESIQTTDQARRRSHDALMSHLQAMSRLLTRVPTDIGPGFDRHSWDDVLRRRWFSYDQLRTPRGREEMTEWAVRMDIVRKARAVEDAIQGVLQTKKADVE